MIKFVKRLGAFMKEVERKIAEKVNDTTNHRVISKAIIVAAMMSNIAVIYSIKSFSPLKKKRA